MSEEQNGAVFDDQAEAQRLFFDEIIRMNDRGHSTTALIAAAAIDNFLEKAIKARMPNLDKDLSAKLFSGYGPFATFSAKIDTAYAMGIVDKSVFSDIHIIKAIRNAFAHPRGAQIVTFSDPVFDKLFAKWPDFKPNLDKPMFLQTKFKDILERMHPAIISGARAGLQLVED